MERQIIGIAANEVKDPGEELHHLPIAYTPSGYVKAVQKAGALPLMLPIGTKEDAKAYIDSIDKLILAGGQNVSPKFYHRTQTATGALLESRDVFELALIDEALKQNKPIFAVCRGLQIMNVFFGGTLEQDLQKVTEIKHMQDPIPRDEPSHDLLTAQGSLVNQIYGDRTQVNSFHYQGVQKLASGLTETAWCPDGVVEAFENQEQRILALQWHPDFAFERQAQEMAAFRYVVNEL